MDDHKHDDDAVRCVALPDESGVSRIYPTTDLADAFEVRLPPDASTDAEQLARFALSHQAPWVAGLLWLRDVLVAGFGLKTAAQLKAAGAAQGGDRRIHIFKVYEIRPGEVLLGEDDKHLDFRISVLHRTRTVAAQAVNYLTVSTVVHCHNRLGRLYILLIAPFHREVVRSSLRRAARAGWPRDAARAARAPG